MLRNVLSSSTFEFLNESELGFGRFIHDDMAGMDTRKSIGVSSTFNNPFLTKRTDALTHLNKFLEEVWDTWQDS